MKKCPALIQEKVVCVSQLIMLAHAGRLSRMPSLSTLEGCMKLSAMVVQGLWECKSPLLQLPHISEDNLKYFSSKRHQVLNKVKRKDTPREIFLKLQLITNIYFQNLPFHKSTFYKKKFLDLVQVRSLEQLARLKEEDRRSVLNHLEDNQYENVIRVLGALPWVEMDVKVEVVDDEATTVYTAGAIVTVIIIHDIDLVI